jgi:hypothetical protein
MAETCTDDRKILSPFDKRECISLKQAAAIASKSDSTLRGWCDEHGLGRRVGGGPWMVSKVALAMFLDGDAEALRAYHAGDRTGDIVAPYLRRFNIGSQTSHYWGLEGSNLPPSQLRRENHEPLGTSGMKIA